MKIMKTFRVAISGRIFVELSAECRADAIMTALKGDSYRTREVKFEADSNTAIDVFEMADEAEPVQEPAPARPPMAAE